MRKFISLIFCTCFTLSLYAQVPGTWNEFFSYNNVQQLIAVDDNIFALSENGIVVYNTSSQEIQKITKLQGLSDVGLTSMAFCDSTSSFLIGYSNGTLDVLSYPSLAVKNIPTIYQKNIPGSKRINKIVMHGDTAILATGLGVFTISMSKYNFISTTIFSNDGSYTPVNSITFSEDEIYAATAKGIYSSNKTKNLSDFSQWKKITGIPYENDTISYIASLNQKIYYAHKNKSDASKDSIFTISNGVAKEFKIQLNNVTNISANKSHLSIVSQYSARLYDATEKLLCAFDSLSQNNAFTDIIRNDGNNWVSDKHKGLYICDTKENILPNGPISNYVTDIYYQDNSLYLVAGKRQLWDNLYFSLQTYSGTWYNYSDWKVANSQCVYPLPDGSRYFIGTYGSGLVENTAAWKTDTVYNESHPLITSYYSGIGPVISDVTADKSGNIWILNPSNDNPLIVKDTKGKWYSYHVEKGSGNLVDQYNLFQQILIDRKGSKWIAGTSNLTVFSENGTLDDKSDDAWVKIPLVDDEGSIATYTTCLAEDLNGTIWIGTDQGIAIHSSPARVFKDRQSISRIKIEIDGEVGYLLHSEQITCIAIDGANRKWIGTEKSGVFLVSENGTEQILHFTKKNSPLPSNTISSLQINNATGEVYIATDEGLVSYVTNATTGDANMNNVRVYPNPVRNTYEGDIYITGVVNDAILKITDISGNLVRTLQANGGTAEWNGRNLYGNKVKTGMYLVYISDEEGNYTKMTKILVIN
ncbi:MAG: T9SS type A sorting domain-containing protein [Bacteroidales bacterium]|nr:T9SS type A sorting domain-containing protein [Bacteroidales bacterium]